MLSLSYGSIVKKDINTSEGLLPQNFNGYNIIEKGDIVLRLTDLQNDKKSLRTGLSKEKGIITSAYVTIRPLENVNFSYFHYLLYAYDILKVFYNMGNGVRQGLNYAELSKLLLIEPSASEQIAIVEYIDSTMEKINTIINLRKQQLINLNTYKKSLIYEYVTGKKSVTEA